jgi:hypothetical protein
MLSTITMGTEAFCNGIKTASGQFRRPVAVVRDRKIQSISCTDSSYLYVPPAGYSWIRVRALYSNIVKRGQ